MTWPLSRIRPAHKSSPLPQEVNSDPAAPLFRADWKACWATPTSPQRLDPSGSWSESRPLAPECSLDPRNGLVALRRQGCQPLVVVVLGFGFFLFEVQL